MHDAMSVQPTPTITPPNVRTVVGQLSFIDRYLPLWIFLAMAIGLVLGATVPGLPRALDSIKVADVSLPIAIGLLWMMYPVLARVKYEDLSHVGRAWSCSWPR
jgi:ACR3 family arsenite transporter